MFHWKMKVRADTFHIHFINIFVESNLIYPRRKGNFVKKHLNLDKTKPE